MVQLLPERTGATRCGHSVLSEDAIADVSCRHSVDERNVHLE